MINCVTVCVADNTAACTELSVFVIIQQAVTYFLFQEIEWHVSNCDSHTHKHSVTLSVFSLLYFTLCSSQLTSLNITVCHVPCTSTKYTNCCCVLSETPKLPAATETLNRHIFPLPQHNLQNISTVSEGGSALHGPHILYSIIFVLHLMTEACVLITKTGQWKKSRTSITYSSYKYVHILTLKNVAHVPHFTKTMAQCPQVSLI